MNKNTRPKAELAHVAEAVRKYLADHDLSMQELGRRLGVPGVNKSSVVTNWVHAFNGPAEPYRTRLAKVLDVSPSYLSRQKQEMGPARKALALVPKKELTTIVADGPAETKLLRSFEEHGDGTVTVKLNSRIPLEKAKEVFKILMDVSL